MDSIVLDLLRKHGEQLANIESSLNSLKTVLNLDEVCRLTGLSKSHLYKLTCWGKIPFYKQAKHLFFDKAEIESWLKANRHTPIDELEIQANRFVTLNKDKSKPVK